MCTVGDGYNGPYVTLLPAAVMGGVSFGLFGLYIAVFALAIASSTLKSRSGDRTNRKAVVYWIVWVTALLITARQMTVITYIRYQSCIVEQLHDRSSCMDEGYGGQTTLSIIVNEFITPFVALFSDGVLAWRVFVVWGRHTWLKFVLIAGLLTNFLLGLMAALLRQPEYHGTGPKSIAFQSWAWITFAINSTMTVSMLIRMSNLRDTESPRPVSNLYRILAQALIESAAVSWMGILGCVVAWSLKSGCATSYEIVPGLINTGKGRITCFDASISTYTDTPGEIYATAIYLVLPTLMGISQVLILTRVNFLKVTDMKVFTKTIAGMTDHEHEEPSLHNDCLIHSPL